MTGSSSTMAMRRLITNKVSWRSWVSCDRIYRSDGPSRRFSDHCHLLATFLRRDATACASGGRIGGAQWHRDPKRRGRRTDVKNGKEAYLECLTRCARGLRCRKSGSVDATDLRNCALCAATSTPGRSRAQERIWTDIMQRRHSNAND